MFIAGADGKTPELRAPSVKGALRFWWRALNGNLSLDDLSKEESLIFGGRVGDKSYRSKVMIKIIPGNISCDSSKEIFKSYLAQNPIWYRSGIKANTLEYLGYGVFDHTTKWPQYILPGSKFTIKFTFEYNDEEILNQVKLSVIDAFKMLYTFGGLGSKSRNGFGQFRPINEDYVLLKNNSKINRDVVSYSCISSNMKLFSCNKSFSTWQEALAFVGNIYRMSKLKLDGDKHKYGKRVLFNAPLIQAKFQNIFSRKAKTHFISINQHSDKTFRPQILNLPYYEIIEKKVVVNKSIKINSLGMEMKQVNDHFNSMLVENPDWDMVKL